MTAPSSDLKSFLAASLAKHGIAGEEYRLECMKGGGSDRRMTRVHHAQGSWVLVENPEPQQGARGLNENNSFVYVAHLLSEAGAFGPELLAEDLSNGRYLVEDLGDHHLLDAVEDCGHPVCNPIRSSKLHLPAVSRGDYQLTAERAQMLQKLYRPVLHDLATMQAFLRERFNGARVHNTPYDFELMTKWESGYFQQRCVAGLAGISHDEEYLHREFEELANAVLKLDCGHFLYRDFQSTNILLHEGRVRYIDFQGSRLGPAQYDLASLLCDPYAALPAALRGDLFEVYLSHALELGLVKEKAFRQGWPLVAVHRVMQALGAYGLLSVVKGKRQFLLHFPVALRTLQELLEEPELTCYAELRRVTEALQSWYEAGGLKTWLE